MREHPRGMADNPKEEVDVTETSERVSAHRPDRMGTVVVGKLLPYSPAAGGERVRDDNGVVWLVVADSIVPCPAEVPRG